jgi:hypothetical protein
MSKKKRIKREREIVSRRGKERQFISMNVAV